MSTIHIIQNEVSIISGDLLILITKKETLVLYKDGNAIGCNEKWTCRMFVQWDYKIHKVTKSVKGLVLYKSFSCNALILKPISLYLEILNIVILYKSMKVWSPFSIICQ